MNDVLIISNHIGLNTPTVVYHNGERLETVGLDIETLVKTWRRKWFRLGEEWLVLACPEREYRALQQRPLSVTRSVQEIFYEHKVIVINAKDIQVKAVEDYCELCRAEHERIMNELESRI